MKAKLYNYTAISVWILEIRKNLLNIILNYLKQTNTSAEKKISSNKVINLKEKYINLEELPLLNKSFSRKIYLL